VPWAVGVGALSLAVPAIGVLNPVGVTALTWLAMFLLGSCAAALLTRFDLESMLGAPLVAMVILLVLVPRVVHALIPGMTAETVVQFLARPSAAFVLGCGLVVVVGAIGLAAFVVAERGFANYRANTARH